MESKVTNMLIKNVKINKIVFMKTYICEEWFRLLNECHNHYRENKKKFICVYCHYKKNLKMRINEHQKKERVWQSCVFQKESSQTEVVCCNPSLGFAIKTRALLAKVQAKSEDRKSHFILSGVEECEKMNPHTPKWTPTLGIGVPMDFRIFRRWL